MALTELPGVCAACLYVAVVVEGRVLTDVELDTLEQPLTSVNGAALCGAHAVRASQRAQWLADVALRG